MQPYDIEKIQPYAQHMVAFKYFLIFRVSTAHTVIGNSMTTVEPTFSRRGNTTSVAFSGYCVRIRIKCNRTCNPPYITPQFDLVLSGKRPGLEWLGRPRWHETSRINFRHIVPRRPWFRGFLSPRNSVMLWHTIK